MNKSKIPTILGVILLTVGLAAGVLLVGNRQIFRLGASAENAPKDVRVTNISDNTFTVSWVTDKEVLGFVSWGDNENSLTRTEEDDVGTVSVTHTTSIKGLLPQQTYFFKINSGGSEYDNNGLPWQVTTGPSLAETGKSNVISGSVLTSTGSAARDALVYITVGGGSPLSTITSQNGSWVIPLSSARTSNLTSLVTIDEQSTLLEISVNAGADGVSSAQIYPQSATPVPAMMLGQARL
jgi:chitodextrinase